MLHDRTSHPTRSTAQQPRLVATAILSLASLAALLVALSVRARAAPPPPLATPGRLRGWWDSGETIDLVAGVAGLAVVAILTYLALVGALATLGALAPGTKLPRVARACMPRVLGAVLAGTVVLTPTSIAAAANGPTPGGPPAPGAGATMRMIHPPRDDAGPRTSGTSDPPAAADEKRTWLPWADEAWPGSAVGRDDPDTAQPEQPPRSDPPPRSDAQERSAPSLDTSPLTPTRTQSAGVPPTPSRYTVRPGDHLWSIAEQVVVAATGDRAEADPTDRQVGRYWRLLIEANADRVSDPDVILPGRELVLPPPPG